MWAIPILIPFVAAFVILVSPTWNVVKRSGEFDSKYALSSNRKKFLIFLLVSFVVTGLISGGLYWGGVASMYDNEVWNCKILKVKHEEKWTTRESRTRRVACGTDSKGNTKYRTETYYVTETHGPYWKAIDEYRNVSRISSSTYNKWKSVWSNEKKVGVHKGSAAGFGRAITGGIFECYWTKEFETIYPWASIHRYKNKVRKAPTVFNLGEPTEELMEKYPRPAEKKNGSGVCYYGVGLHGVDDLHIRRVNAHLGPKYQIHTLLIPLGKDDRYKVQDILTAWQGPNKNELVTFFGHENGVPAWCEVHSWMDDTTLHGNLRDWMMSAPFTTDRYAKALLSDVPKHWIRKEFEDFDYLKVSIHWGWILAALLTSLVAELVVFLIVDGEAIGKFRVDRYRRGLGKKYRRWSR